MADVFTKAQRSMVMARIRGRDNASTEMRTVGLLRAAKLTGVAASLANLREAGLCFSKGEGRAIR